MTPDQVRAALRELNGERDCTFAFGNMPVNESMLIVQKAMLIPDEPDHLVKVTDGKSVYIIDAERLIWIQIGLATKDSQRR
jgi:hypothetical protein